MYKIEKIIVSDKFLKFSACILIGWQYTLNRFFITSSKDTWLYYIVIFIELNVYNMSYIYMTEVINI